MNIPVWAVAQAYREGQHDTEQRLLEVFDIMDLSRSEVMLIQDFLKQALPPFWNKDGVDNCVNQLCK